MARTYNNVNIVEKTVRIVHKLMYTEDKFKILDIFHGKMPAIV